MADKQEPIKIKDWIYYTNPPHIKGMDCVFRAKEIVETRDKGRFRVLDDSGNWYELSYCRHATQEEIKKQTPKRSQPKYPMDYLFSVADKIHKTNPTRKIILNTLMDVWGDGTEYGYLRSKSDDKYFRDKREKRRKNSFDMAMTNIDNLINNKNKSK